MGDEHGMEPPLKVFDEAVKRLTGGGDTDEEKPNDPTEKKENADKEDAGCSG